MERETERRVHESGREALPDYGLLPQPPYLRRIIRDARLGRVAGASHAYSRKLAAQLLSSEPLTPLSNEERGLLKAYLTETFDETQDDAHRKVTVLLGDGVEPPELLHRLTSLDGWDTEFEMPTKSGSKRKTALSIWRSMGGLSSQLDQWFRSAMERKTGGGRQVVFMDVGAAECQFAHEVKETYGSDVLVHATGLESQPHAPVDFFHQICGEHFPKDFGGLFDVVVSQGALEFSLLPHIFIENVAKSLALNGEAGLKFDAVIGMPSIMDEKLADRVRGYYGQRGVFERINDTLRSLGESASVEGFVIQTRRDGTQEVFTLDEANVTGCSLMLFMMKVPKRGTLVLDTKIEPIE